MNNNSGDFQLCSLNYQELNVDTQQTILESIILHMRDNPAKDLVLDLKQIQNVQNGESSAAWLLQLKRKLEELGKGLIVLSPPKHLLQRLETMNLQTIIEILTGDAADELRQQL